MSMVIRENSQPKAGQTGIGIIGCGVISDAYLKSLLQFEHLDVRGLADLRPEAAAAVAQKHGLQAMSVDALLRDDSIEIVVNLTLPAAHVQVDMQVLAAGKHVYAEKPLALNLAQAQPLMELATQRNLRIGSAPDTFLGGGHQACRALVDAGKLGQIVAGTAFFMCPGHERWHPAPAFYYQTGGGPMLDMGPYYITVLVNLLGPVSRVTGMTSRLRKQRPITSQPLNGQIMIVEVDTHVTGTLEFANGALISVATSFDVPKHGCKPIELHGTEASMQVPDPNRFGGPINMASAGQDWTEREITHVYADGNFRGLGVADMAMGLRTGQAHRASGQLAYHVLEVMEAFGASAATGRHVSIQSKVERPAPMLLQPTWAV
jgi:predicted dehydrogenase